MPIYIYFKVFQVCLSNEIHFLWKHEYILDSLSSWFNSPWHQQYQEKNTVEYKRKELEMYSQKPSLVTYLLQLPKWTTPMAQFMHTIIESNRLNTTAKYYIMKSSIRVLKWFTFWHWMFQLNANCTLTAVISFMEGILNQSINQV